MKQIGFNQLGKRIVSILLIGALLATGCGKKETQDVIVSEEEQPDYEALYREENINDIMTGKWKKEKLTDADEFMKLKEYTAGIIPINHSGEKYNWGYYADSNYIYSLDDYYEKNDKGEYISSLYLNKINISDMTLSSTEYTFYDRGTMINLYAVCGRVFASLQCNSDKGELTEYCIVELKQDGSIEKMRNMTEEIIKNDWLPDLFFVVDTTLMYEPISGNTFLFSKEKDCLIIIDENGETVIKFQGFNEEVKSKIEYFASADDGHIILVCRGNSEETIFIYEDGEIKILYQGDIGQESLGDSRFIDSHGRILFLCDSNHTIASWDTESGKQEKLYSTGEVSQYVNDIDCFARNEKGEILILSENNLKILSMGGAAKKVEIVLKPLTFLSYMVKQYIDKYEEMHPGVTFKILEETEWENRDVEMNKLYTELINGEGPDIIMLNNDQLGTLAETEGLYELSNVLTEDVKNKLIPAVRDSGYANGGKYAMSLEPNIRTFIINKKYCKNDTWSIMDIVDILEQKEAANEPFEWVIAEDYFYNNPFGYLLYLNIAESEFIDMDNFTCDFDSNNFVRFLNICKKYNDRAENTVYPQNQSISLMKNDKALMYIDVPVTLREYSEAFSQLGDEYRTIGHPTKKGNGNKIIFSGNLAVNKKTMETDSDKKMVIEDFLNGLYIPDNMAESLSYSVPIRMDAYDGRIILPSDNDWVGSQPAIRIGPRTISPIPGKADGTTYVDEYLKLLSQCENMSVTDTVTNTICGIIEEETEGFFNNGKSAEETAKIIQTRVNLYLMEIK